MSYPQPDAGKYTVGGYQFFRLNTPLVSDGDIYEAAVSGLAFAIGPESDISRVNIAYFDDQVSNFLNQVTISPSRPFTGRLDARNEAKYAPSGVPGRILLWSDELFADTFSPSGRNPLTDRFDVVTPTLDVIQYFSAPPGVFPERNDKEFIFQQLPWPAGGEVYWLMVPYYGRKYASFAFSNGTDQIITTSIIGVNFLYNGTVGYETTLQAATAVAALGGQLRKIVKGSVDGVFDYLLVKMDPAAAPNGNATPLRIIVSDTEV